MVELVKNIGKGFLYIIALPFFLIVLSITAVLGLFILLYMFVKSIFLFFTGRSLSDELPEDRKVREIKEGKIRKESTPEHVVIETDKQENIEIIAKSEKEQKIEDAVFKNVVPEDDSKDEPEEIVFEELNREEPQISEPIEEETNKEVEPIQIEKEEDKILDNFVNEPMKEETKIEEIQTDNSFINNDNIVAEEIKIGDYGHNSADSRIVEDTYNPEEEEEDNGVTISFGDIDD